MSRITKAATLILAVFALTACTPTTTAQKRAVKVASFIVVGSAIAMVASHNGGQPNQDASRQFPCGCTPPPAVK